MLINSLCLCQEFLVNYFLMVKPWSWTVRETHFFCLLHKLAYWKHYASPLVITLSDISALFKRWDETWSQHFFFLLINQDLSYYLWEKKFQSQILCYNFPFSSVVICTLNLWSECIKVSALCSDLHVLCFLATQFLHHCAHHLTCVTQKHFISS